MQQEGAGPDLPCSGCLCHGPELQAALPGIRENLRPVPLPFESIFNLLTDIPRMVVRIAVFRPVCSDAPLPFCHRRDMVAEDNGGPE
jgi:hypothetical protein